MLKRLLPGLIMLSFMLIFAGCGSGGSGSDAPATATITVNPPTDVEVAGGTSSAWYTKDFQIVVKTANGVPLNDVTLYISYIWAVPSSAGHAQLYDGTTAKDSPMQVKTDDNGVYNLRFDFQSGGALEYSGNIQVVSGSIFGSRGFAVTAGE